MVNVLFFKCSLIASCIYGAECTNLYMLLDNVVLFFRKKMLFLNKICTIATLI